MGSNMAAVGWDKYYTGSVAMGTHRKAPAFTPGCSLAIMLAGKVFQ
jgi:hypothetical protein